MKFDEMFNVARNIKLKVFMSIPNNNYITEIMKYCNCSYSGMYKDIIKLERSGLIITEKRGRNRYINITEKGYHILKNLRDIKKILEDKKINEVNKK